MAIEFNGSTQYLTRAGAVVSAAPCTLGAWFNCNNSVSEQKILAVSASTGNPVFALVASGDVGGDPITARRVANDGTIQGTNSTTGYTTGTWHHGLAVITSSTKLEVWLDGGSYNTGTTPSTSPPGINRTTIGVLSRSSDMDFFNGRIAEAAVWNAALTAAEAGQLARGFSPLLIRPGNLVAYWPLYGNNDPARDFIRGSNLTWVSSPVKAEHPRIIMPHRRHIIMAPAAVSGVTGILATTELGDTFTANGFLTHTGQLVLTEAGDAFAALGTLTTIGTLALTESGDIALFQGNVGAEVTGVLNATENIDIAAFVGHSTHTGIVVVAESGDVFVAFGTSGDVTPGVGGGWRFKRLALKIGLGL